MLFRMRYAVYGGHTHVKVFAGEGTFSLGKAGDLVFRNEEWVEFQKSLNYFMVPGSDIEILPETGLMEVEK